MSRFNVLDYKECDQPARDLVTDLFEKHFNCAVECNDGKDQDKVDYHEMDLVITDPNGRKRYVEVEMKRDGWKYIYSGIHFTFRKIQNAFGVKKYNPKECYFCSVNKELNEIIVVPGIYLYLAWRIWPEYDGFSSVKKSLNFVMPEHQCYPVMKFTTRDRSKPETFINVDYKRVNHYIVENGLYCPKQYSDRKFSELE